MRKLNFTNPVLFEAKFGRKPKIWTIESIHELWLRTVERAKKRRDEILKVREEIVTKLKPNKSGKYVVYYECIDYNNEPAIGKYTFEWHDDWKSYGVSTGYYKDDKSASQENRRNKKIDFLIQNELAFELGEEYNNAKKYECKLNHFVGSILSEMLNDTLREHYRKLDTIPPKIEKVQINGVFYYIQCESQSRYSYPKFEFLGEVKDTTLNFKGNLVV